MSSIKKKKMATPSLPKYPFIFQSRKFCVSKTHLYQLSLVSNILTIPPHVGEITGSNKDDKNP